MVQQNDCRVLAFTHASRKWDLHDEMLLNQVRTSWKINDRALRLIGRPWSGHGQKCVVNLVRCVARSRVVGAIIGHDVDNAEISHARFLSLLKSGPKSVIRRVIAIRALGANAYRGP